MKKTTKNIILDLVKIFGGMGTLVALMVFLPQGSIAHYILGGLMVTALIISAVWLTPLGNPLKRLIRKIQAKKK